MLLRKGFIPRSYQALTQSWPRLRVPQSTALDISWGAALSKSPWKELLEAHSHSSVGQKPTINVQTTLCSLCSLSGAIPS